MISKNNKIVLFKKGKKHETKVGFSLVEMLLYVFLVTLLTVVVVNSLVFMSKNYYAISGEKNIAISASTFLNRFSYETRQATSVSVATSSLTLTGGSGGTMVFSTSTSNQLTLNGNSLSVPGVQVTKISFKPLKTSVTQGVSVQMTLLSGTGSSTRSQNFELTTMLRSN